MNLSAEAKRLDTIYGSNPATAKCYNEVNYMWQTYTRNLVDDLKHRLIAQLEAKQK